MSSMSLILTEDVSSLGLAGDIVNVKAGYGRNYLLPQKKAMLADSKNVKALEHAKFLAEHKVKKMKAEFEGLAEKLSAVTVTLSHKVGEGDKLFGSVTTMEIERALKEKGFEIDRKKILLEKPIKELGEFSVPVKLHPEITTALKIEVVKEEA